MQKMIERYIYNIIILIHSESKNPLSIVAMGILTILPYIIFTLFLPNKPNILYAGYFICLLLTPPMLHTCLTEIDAINISFDITPYIATILVISVPCYFSIFHLPPDISPQIHHYLHCCKNLLYIIDKILFLSINTIFMYISMKYARQLLMDNDIPHLSYHAAIQRTKYLPKSCRPYTIQYYTTGKVT